MIAAQFSEKSICEVVHFNTTSYFSNIFITILKTNITTKRTIAPTKERMIVFKYSYHQILSKYSYINSLKIIRICKLFKLK